MMMLRNRSRSVTTKQALMADEAPNQMPTSPISSFFTSPRFLNAFWTKILSSDTLETSANNSMMIMSPTSILGTNFPNSFGYGSPALSPTAKHEASRAIGLALIDSIEKASDGEQGKFPKPINRFGSKLKVQIPATTIVSPISANEESPKSPADFGIKTKNSQMSSPPTKDCYLTRQLSLKEMELSEDYTRVITHGPNPKTTHIFDDCIVEGCLGDDDDEEDKKMMEYGFEDDNVSTSVFLSFCHTCKDHLGPGIDIYTYRDEKAFCSHECRCEEIYSVATKNKESDEQC